MASAESIEEPPKKKGLLFPLLFGIVGAAAAGGGAFFAASSGMLGGDATETELASDKAPEAAPMPGITFLELDPMIVSLSGDGYSRHLRFRGHLEVFEGQEENVTKLTPRILDVLNSYLRALDVGTLEEPDSLVRIRINMLRRVQLVVGEGRVRDLLVTEFVLN